LRLRRSLRAAGQTLQELGFTDVRNLGGFSVWDQENLPVEPAEGST
jgi:rhodanese-related sulfurtransferase